MVVACAHVDVCDGSRMHARVRSSAVLANTSRVRMAWLCSDKAPGPRQRGVAHHGNERAPTSAQHHPRAAATDVLPSVNAKRMGGASQVASVSDAHTATASKRPSSKHHALAKTKSKFMSKHRVKPKKTDYVGLGARPDAPAFECDVPVRVAIRQWARARRLGTCMHACFVACTACAVSVIDRLLHVPVLRPHMPFVVL